MPKTPAAADAHCCVCVVLKLRVKLRESLEQDIVVIMAENKLSAAETFKKLD